MLNKVVGSTLENAISIELFTSVGCCQRAEWGDHPHPRDTTWPCVRCCSAERHGLRLFPPTLSRPPVSPFRSGNAVERRVPHVAAACQFQVADSDGQFRPYPVNPFPRRPAKGRVLGGQPRKPTQ